jgi:hypothetical protein
MDSAQEEHERRVGEQLMGWYNQWHGTSFRFDGRPDDAPDSYYSDGNVRLRVEVTSAFYDDGDDAKYEWLRQRGHPDAPDKWEGKDFEQYLVNDINLRIAAKCMNSYGPNCLLAVYVFPKLTFANEMETLIKSVSVPATHRFDGTYLCGEFPTPLDLYISRVLEDERPPPERRVWQLYPADEPPQNEQRNGVRGHDSRPWR